MRQKQHSNTEADYKRARNLRHNATPYEQKLWLALRGEAKKVGFKFRRQHVLHPFIVDFACLPVRLVIEIDGYSHDLVHTHDKDRENKIIKMGYTILRFTNEDVDQNCEGVVYVILSKAQELMGLSVTTPTPYPRP